MSTYVQIPRGPDGEIAKGFAYPKTEEARSTHHAALLAKVGAFQARHARRALESQCSYIAACPAKKDDEESVAAYLAKWSGAKVNNYTEWDCEAGGFDGEHHPGDVDNPGWGFEEAIAKWVVGEGWHERHYPSFHFPRLREAISRHDNDFAEEGHGSSIYLTKALHARLDDFLNDAWGFTPKEAKQLLFAEEVGNIIAELHADCLEHHLLTMSGEDTVFLCAAMSRLPQPTLFTL